MVQVPKQQTPPPLHSTYLILQAFQFQIISICAWGKPARVREQLAVAYRVFIKYVHSWKPGIAGLNSSRGKDVLPRFPELCYVDTDFAMGRSRIQGDLSMSNRPSEGDTAVRFNLQF
jgi:hypothetical protein